LLGAQASYAGPQIYKVTDDKNGVVFTDSPGIKDNTADRSVEEIELKELNTVAPVEMRPPADPSGGANPESEAAPEPTVSIMEPANESTVAMGPGNFAVSASATPALSRGERLVLLMDGVAQGPPQASPSWFIEGVLRGPHDLVVQRTTSSGKVVASSESVRIYVLRPSLIRR
ncbi:MAG: hypothetical protein NWP69_13235, partial [Congregibacter sp.]|nr:hypothetical protein [Congregibacter sp.]